MFLLNSLSFFEEPKEELDQLMAAFHQLSQAIQVRLKSELDSTNQFIDYYLSILKRDCVTILELDFETDTMESGEPEDVRAMDVRIRRTHVRQLTVKHQIIYE